MSVEFHNVQYMGFMEKEDINTMNILYQFNEKYAPFAGTSVTSLFENNKDEKIVVYVLGEGLSEESAGRFRELAHNYGQQIEFKETAAVIQKMKTWGLPSYRGAYSANLRLFLPYFLDENVERLLYLDADTIVSGNIRELYETPVRQEMRTIAMALDSLGNSSYKTAQLGFGPDEPYFNSGVILFDLKKWRENNYSEKIAEHVRAGHNHYTSPDQDLLNVVCKGDIERLPAKYNFQPVHYVFDDRTYFGCYGYQGYYSEEELQGSRKDVRIYHSFRFVGEFPWDKDTVHPYRELFDKYLSRSPWKDYVKKKAEGDWKMKAGKVLYRVLPRKIYLRIFTFFHGRYLSEQPETAGSRQDTERSAS